MLKFYRFLLLPLTAVFLASTAGIACYAADSCTQARMYRQLAAQTENFPDDTVSTGNDFLPQYQAMYAQNSDLAGWIQIDGTNINYPVMQSKHDPDFYLKHNFEKADSPHGCPYVQANCTCNAIRQHPCVRTQHEGIYYVLICCNTSANSFGSNTGLSAGHPGGAGRVYRDKKRYFGAKRRTCLPIIDVPMPKHRRNLPPMWAPARTPHCTKPACRLLMVTS